MEVTCLHVTSMYWNVYMSRPVTEICACHAHILKCLHVTSMYWNFYMSPPCTEMSTFPIHVLKCLHVISMYWNVYTSCPCTEMSICHVHVLKCLHVMLMYWNVYMSCPYTEMSTWWWLLVTETCSKLCIIEYIVVFWLNDILVSTTTQRDGFYKKRLFWDFLSEELVQNTKQWVALYRMKCANLGFPGNARVSFCIQPTS